MNNLIKLLEDLRTRKLNMKVSPLETIWNQTERNQIRSELIDAFYKDLLDAFDENGIDTEVFRTTDGTTVSVQNEEWGNFCFSIAPKMHDLDYDAYDEEEIWFNKVKAKSEKKSMTKRKKS